MSDFKTIKVKSDIKERLDRDLGENETRSGQIERLLDNNDLLDRPDVKDAIRQVTGR